jgi:hypothetical protein
MTDNTNPHAELVGDDLQQTEQAHFDEFAAIQAALNETEPLTSNSEQYQPAEAVSVSGAELIFPVVGLACAVLAPSWNITTDEQQALADNYGAVIDKYFPEGAGSFGVELSALLVTGAILAPRLGTPRKPEKETKTDEKAAD